MSPKTHYVLKPKMSIQYDFRKPSIKKQRVNTVQKEERFDTFEAFEVSYSQTSKQHSNDLGKS